MSWLVVLVVAVLSLLPPAAQADTLELAGQAVQGGLVLGRVDPGSAVAVDGRPVRVSADGVFVVGFGREAVKAALEVAYPDGRRARREIAVAPRRFDIQRIDGLPERMVTPPPEALERIKRENEEVAAVRQRDDARTDFLASFQWPVVGRISGVYGSQRILNGQPRAPHYGVDIASPVGTPIRAPADGIVTLAADLYFTGWTVILDHGHGLSSVFMHMKSIAAEVGQRLKQGDMLGQLGASGRVTGPHLHWGMNWFTTRLDPALLVPPMPPAPAAE